MSMDEDGAFGRTDKFSLDDIKQMILKAAARSKKRQADALLAEIAKQMVAQRIEDERILALPLEDRVTQATEMALMCFQYTMKPPLSQTESLKDLKEVRRLAELVAKSTKQKIPNVPSQKIEDIIKDQILTWFISKKDTLFEKKHVPRDFPSIETAWEMFLAQYTEAFRIFAFPKNRLE
ncbi:hypothetical protein HY969_02555 [Candidatus Kaiserbacteria bacterium]|nr:hypothetical protein [Candidatus Kaiserbacteria bacterium]